MGYGLGIFLLALGLILALAVTDSIAGVDLTMVGYILAIAGLLVLALTAFTLNNRRRSQSVTTTTHADGSQAVSERRTDLDPPAV